MEGSLWIPMIVTNLLAIGLLVGCWKWPAISAMLYSVIFLAAGLFNGYLAMREPNLYVEGYAPLAVFPFYRDFIEGWFARHTTLAVAAIAGGQILISAGLLLKGKWFLPAIAGGVLFFVGIAPLGMGSAFPSTLIMAASLVILYSRYAMQE